MLFDSLDNLRRRALLTSILLVALGVVLLICPEKYIISLTLAFGYTLIIISIVMLLEFFTSKKSLMEYIKFCGALILGIVGLCSLVFRENVMRTLAGLSSFLLLVYGISVLYFSLTYARRSHRRGWWLFTILAILLVACAVVLFINPWWGTPVTLIRIIGYAVLFSALVSTIRLIWGWSLNRKRGGEVDAE